MAILKKKKKHSTLDRANMWMLYVFLVPAVLLTLIFGYIPMFTNVIAFMDYDIMDGFLGLGSPFVGLKHFSFLTEKWFYDLAIRTVGYSTAGLIIGFPASLVLALMFNELRSLRFKKIVQTISYIPNFVSWVTISGLVYIFLSVEPEGILNTIRESLFGLPRISFMQDPKYFLPLLVFTNVWKGVGWGTILYMAALSAVDEQIYEAADVDGAGRFAKILHITFPSLIPTFCIQLIFSLGGLFSSNFDQIFNLQNPVIRDNVMTINLYTYYSGIVGMKYSLTTAVGLFQGVISFLLIYITNTITRKLSDTGIF
jgi:ABC-type polysaccharide transport system, permease component